ncbi:uncharacterized protein LOC128987119 isoform X1 [Macrosteles quadrilineatus]|uniref:uncharacterized protein LOC128987119 isoform X1 n=1 Tax=Macrosteles quadrilineatus TaxID=74068 RepID=UPI0023E0DB12|nr:uncharacterized protein LOC128987119 isoform X1 [Macrosteles quadrilineatus]XP_054263805.1 uncharacterized protein LOC128987119 isoform X1 [Macrosteles quadrilineatus]
MHLNIQGVKNKIDDLNLILEKISKNTQIICLNEHWLTEENICMLNKVKGYYMVDYYIRKSAKRGGTAILLKEGSGINCKVRDDLKVLNADFYFECSVVEILNFSEPVIIISLYRVPYKFTLGTFLKKLQSMFRMFKSRKKVNVFFATDCNVNVLDSVESKEFYNVINFNGFKINIKEVTRPISNTCIDNIITNKKLTLTNILVEDIGLSDHSAIWAEIPNFKCKVENKKYTLKRRFTPEAIHEFKESIKQTDWKVESNKSANENYDNFLREFMLNMNESFPVKPLRQENGKVIKWITEGIKISSKKKRLLHSEIKINKSAKLQNYYKIYRRIFRKVVRAAKRKANDDFIKRSKCKSRASWRVIKNELGMIQKNNNDIKEILIDGKTINNPIVIPNYFNNHYLKIKQQLKVQSLPHRAIECCSKVAIPDNTEFTFKEVKEIDVLKIIKSISNKRSTGWDEIPVRLIKDCKEYIAAPLTKIINQSLKTGEFPTNLKTSIVRPIFKKGNRNLIENYRPVSLLPVFSKIIEKVVHTQLQEYLESNRLITNSQHGFRKSHSTNSALISLTDDIYKAMDGSQSTLAVCCDLSKAFDCVDHAVLLKKLTKYGIRGSSWKWFESYLTGRRQKISIIIENNKYESEYDTVVTGVPQGSILGPVLFTTPTTSQRM